MPVPEAQIEVPDIEVLDTPFKKVLACSAAFLVLFGSLLALAASRAGEHEQKLSAQAQEASITALAEYGAAFAEISELAGSDAEARSLRQRAEAARAASSLTGLAAYTAAANEWDKSSRALTDLAIKDTDAIHYDDVSRDAVERLYQPRVTSLRADAQRETATAWSAKADRYILGITLLAVALSLLGLSLTLARRIRILVLVPAVVITLFAAGVSVAAAVQRPAVTSDAAVRALAEGDKQMSLRKYDEAIKSYSEAIRLRGDYPLAYRARATAADVADSPELNTYTFTLADEESRTQSIADLDRALDLNPVPDYMSLVNQGANLFHVRRYAESEELTRRALASNDRLPLPWANLALVQAAQGREAEARESYAEMIRRAGSRPDPVEQAELYASSRTTLEILASMEPHRAELVRDLQGLLVAAQAEQVSPGANQAGADAKISALKLVVNGWALAMTYQSANLPARSRVSWIGYFRAGPSDPWQQRLHLVAIDRLAVDNPSQRYFLDVACLGRGEYRLDVWLDDRLLATTTAPRSSTAARYVGSYESAGRISACRPHGWKLDDDVLGQLRLSDPRPDRETVAVRTAPLPAELLGQPAPEVIAKALDTDPSCAGFGTATGQTPYFVGGVQGAFRQYPLQSDGRNAWCWAGVGTDNSLRTVVARYGVAADSAPIVNDLVGQLYFNVPSP